MFIFERRSNLAGVEVKGYADMFLDGANQSVVRYKRYVAFDLWRTWLCDEGNCDLG